ncbi:histidine phosphatase family protein [Shimazuella sp. AN120528]|uniref:histidine phosphatase family protein n=1 Tax=Shimazuella soli TaxID=1892854 RepID=UPI001F0E2BA0|nr:histidine phosphatase family protein [Shimazuella soli]MCH5586352.1 histidine phosphatase family protein [Shimazuella soli]
MDTTIYIVRHGQTEWNLEGRLQGRLDSPLTDAGVEQAKQLAQRLQNISFHSIYSSSSNRAFSTALHLKKDREIEVNKSDHLMEMDFATWEGRKWSEIQDLFPEELLLMNEHPERFEAKETKGETFYDIQRRLASFIDKILKQHAGQNILLVSHSITIKVLINYLRGGNLKYLWDGPDIHWASLYEVCFTEDKTKIFFEEEEILPLSH